MLKNRLLPVAALAAAAFSTSANALTFNLTSLNAGTAVGTEARRGFEIAAAYWSSVLTDNTTMNLSIGFSTLGSGILGSTSSVRSLFSMNQVYAALAADTSSQLDVQAVANLRALGVSSSVPGAGAVSFRANALNGTAGNYLDTSTRIDNDGSVNNSTLAITKASAKALGLTVDVNGTAVAANTRDATIQFSDAFAFDFDARDGIGANAFDFVGIAIHEIGHALGFTSGVDSYDFYTSPGTANVVTNADGTVNTTALEGFVVNSTLDLFRYGAAGELDWSTQKDVYFSIDGGQSQLFGDSRMSLGVANGDGRQASHFKDSPAGAAQLGVLDPTSGRGQMQDVTALDLAAFDAIGWNTNVDVLANSGYRLTTAQITRNAIGDVPEPATWGMMILGFGAVGASMRRRKPAAVAA